MLEFSTHKTLTAKKNHICELCGGVLATGEKYSRFCGKYDGYMFDTKLHFLCENIIGAYCRYIDDNEYSDDEVRDWLEETCCADCEHCDEEREDYCPPCPYVITTCPKITKLFGGTRDEQ